ncbi:MAG: TfoX/Sxy family protein [Thermomicrobiales bacterium]|nr:TfoX/Sxy family protein [Thermomicrobiales bacterium]
MNYLEQAELVSRIRGLLTHEPSLREVAMFGGKAIMINDKMVVCAMRSGNLLVRIAPERREELVARPGATQAEMGAGRSMGPSWLSVVAEAIADDDQLSGWLDVALEYNRTLT